MNILLTNHALTDIGGSETFTYAVAQELSRRGDRVSVYSPAQGFVATKLNELPNVQTIAHLASHYDVILSSHNNTLFKILSDAVKGFKIHTSHGCIHPLERSIMGADKYVSVSEEVQSSLQEKGIASVVIRNGVNINRFKSIRPISPSLKTVGCLCQGSNAVRKVREACKIMGLEFISMHKNKDKLWNVEEYINKCDLVVSLGRGAIESLACGRNVVVYDSRPYMNEWMDGMITPENIQNLQTHNFSGRKYKQSTTTVQDLIHVFEQYDDTYHDFFVNYSREEFNIQIQIDKYLALIT